MPIGAGGSFQYVFIPASLDEEIVERKLEMLPGKEVECLTDELKGHFQQFSNPAGDTSSGSVMDAIKAQLAAKHGDEAAANLDPEVLKMFANQQIHILKHMKREKVLVGKVTKDGKTLMNQNIILQETEVISILIL